MKSSRVAREQQIAVFGESGSGKTVLLSSFYGRTQEASFIKSSLYNVVADNTAQGLKLHQNFLGMKNEATKPLATRRNSTRYSFAIKRRAATSGKKSQTLEDLRLVWHDYPGEWFEEDPQTEEELRRRVETFRTLLGSDVAVLLVDGQRLLDSPGEEERYLKSLLTNYRTHLSRLRPQLLPDGKPLARFPRIWILGLSKADLLPDTDVVAFRDLLIQKTGEEISLLQDELATFIEEPEALSVGEDYVLLSSAQFEPGHIDVDHQVGVPLVLPIAAMLPFSRYIGWAKALRHGSKVAADLSHTVIPVLALIATKAKLPGPLGLIAAFMIPKVTEQLPEMAGDKLRKVHHDATARHDFLTAVLTGFQLDLDQAVTDGVLLKSLK